MVGGVPNNRSTEKMADVKIGLDRLSASSLSCHIVTRGSFVSDGSPELAESPRFGNAVKSLLIYNAKSYGFYSKTFTSDEADRESEGALVPFDMGRTGEHHSLTSSTIVPSSRTSLQLIRPSIRLVLCESMP